MGWDYPAFHIHDGASRNQVDRGVRETSFVKCISFWIKTLHERRILLQRCSSGCRRSVHARSGFGYRGTAIAYRGFTARKSSVKSLISGSTASAMI